MLDILQELYDNGITALPIVWDIATKTAKAHPEHDTNKVTIDINYCRSLLNGTYANANGIAIKVIPPLGMIDFDLKNTDNKQVYSDWLKMVQSEQPDVMSKIVISETRSGGYHVYFKYSKLSHKIPLARSNNREVISVYTGELLSYEYPTPGYKIIHNDWNDLDFITSDEYHTFVTCGAHFNEDTEVDYKDKVIVSYPTEYESTCLQFDNKIDDITFERLLNSISLYRNTRQSPNKKWYAFTREGSTAAYSAKVYFYSKRCLIFSASMPDYPSWHDSAKAGDTSWSLTPSKIVYYKNKRNWDATIEEINMICEAANIDITPSPSVTEQPMPQNIDRLKFPYDIFPDEVLNFINHQSLQPEYMAAGLLVAASTAIGNTVQLEALDGYNVKPILYLAIVAPPGSAKTPALKKVFAPLERYDAHLYAGYKEEMKEYRTKLAEAKKDKKEEPEQPKMQQLLIKDSTIEMVIKILSHNPLGCGILADELSGFLKRMNQYKDGDEVQKWLEMWSGAPVLIQRITREENKVEEPYCNIIGGIQPGVLESLSKNDNQYNGFYHRFLFCFPDPMPKGDFQWATVPNIVKHEFNQFFDKLLAHRGHGKETYILSQDALKLYQDWYAYKNLKYNATRNDNFKGIISKYQDYCLRFAILIQLMNEPHMMGMVSYENMNRAIRLTEYFFGMMHKALKILSPETEVDTLAEDMREWYTLLPPTFTMKTAIETGKPLGVKETTIKNLLNGSKSKKFFEKIKYGEYSKKF